MNGKGETLDNIKLKVCQKTLLALGDENCQHLILEMMQILMEWSDFLQC